MVHVRRDGHAPPVPSAVRGKACKCSGLCRTNPVTNAFTSSTRAGSAVIARDAGGAAHPTVVPSNQSATVGRYST